MTVEIKQGDSLRLLQDLPDDSVDAVVTDPPYSSGGMFRADRQKGTLEKYLHTGAESADRLPEFYGDSRTERGLLLWSSLWLAETWRITKRGGGIAVFCDWRSLPTFSDALQVGGWVWRGIGVWVKPPGKSRPTPGGLWNDSEYILWGSKGPRAEGADYLPGTWQVAAPASKHRLHPTEKPQAVLRDLVRLAPVGGLVLDPFAGSGSTGVAAKAQGRACTLIELSPEYCEIARRRVEAIDTYGADVTKVHSMPGIFDGGASET